MIIRYLIINNSLTTECRSLNSASFTLFPALFFNFNLLIVSILCIQFADEVKIPGEKFGITRILSYICSIPKQEITASSLVICTPPVSEFHKLKNKTALICDFLFI
jgi:hypothetical protein